MSLELDSIIEKLKTENNCILKIIPPTDNELLFWEDSQVEIIKWIDNASEVSLTKLCLKICAKVMFIETNTGNYSNSTYDVCGQLYDSVVKNSQPKNHPANILIAKNEDTYQLAIEDEIEFYETGLSAINAVITLAKLSNSSINIKSDTKFILRCLENIIKETVQNFSHLHFEKCKVLEKYILDKYLSDILLYDMPNINNLKM